MRSTVHEPEEITTEEWLALPPIEEMREGDETGDYVGSVMGWYAKGRHDPFTFLKAVQQHLLDYDDDDTPLTGIRWMGVTRWRNVPVGPHAPGYYLMHPSKPGPGAYVVTVARYE